MKKKAFLTIIGVLALQAMVYADWVNGTVQKVDESRDVLFINRIDAEKNKSMPEQLEVKVTNDAKLKNISSLTELKTGNEVKVDVQENKNLGIWEARGVELVNPANKKY